MIGPDILVHVQASGIKLKKSGKEWRGNCPFHPDDKPSFYVNQEKNVFFCHGCERGGGARRFQQLMGGIDQKTGVRMSQIHPHETGSHATKMGNLIVDHYHESLWKNQEALAYLAGRGLGDHELLRKYRVGFANGDLSRQVKSGSLEWWMLKRMGYITRRDSELMKGCVVWAITNFLGEDSQMYGRCLNNVNRCRHRYLAAPRQGVWNWQGAREAAASGEPIVLCESVIDVMSCVLAGYQGAVPLYGANGLIPDHQVLLGLLRPERVVLLLDNDDAGRRSEKAIAEKLSIMGLKIALGRIEGAKDPNEVLTRLGPEALRQCVEAGRPIALHKMLRSESCQ